MERLNLQPWWSALNRALNELGLASAPPSEARRWYWITNPRVAALWIKAERCGHEPRAAISTIT